MSASSALIVIYSVILYNYIKVSILDTLTESLRKEARLIAQSKSAQNGFDLYNPLDGRESTKAKIVIRVDIDDAITYEKFKKLDRYYLTVYYPYDRQKSSYIALTRDVTHTNTLLNKILFDIFV